MPSAYSWWPNARFPNTNCAAFVRSRQSTQFVRQTPFCSKIVFRYGRLLNVQHKVKLVFINNTDSISSRSRCETGSGPEWKKPVKLIDSSATSSK